MKVLTSLLLAALVLSIFYNEAKSPLQASHTFIHEPGQADGDLLWRDLEPGGDRLRPGHA